MAGACIRIYIAERLDESYRAILRRFQKYVIEDTCWFSIELEDQMKHTYTKFEKQQLTEVFGCFPKQEILIFGECDRIFVVAYEIVKHFGGFLSINIGTDREHINSHKGIKIEVHKKNWTNPIRHNPIYWLVDHVFIREFFAPISGNNFEKFKLEMFLPYA